MIGGNGGSKHFLYTLTRAPLSADNPIPAPSSTHPPGPVQGSNTLGKLEILWRTVLGEAGRLQTQQILGNVSALPAPPSLTPGGPQQGGVGRGGVGSRVQGRRLS